MIFVSTEYSMTMQQEAREKLGFQDPPEVEVVDDWGKFEIGEPIISKSHRGEYSTIDSSVPEWRKGWTDIQVFASNDLESNPSIFSSINQALAMSKYSELNPATQTSRMLLE
ncbi:MAG: hypothetical protein IPG99_15145 [Ignavibacteria bacterium]|nr:hypothetical protein [Ignavibacteria bacterium]